MLKFFLLFLAILLSCEKKAPETIPEVPVMETKTTEPPVASITALTPVAQHRSSGQKDWKDASLNLNLINRDEIKTSENASARVDFFSGKSGLSIQEKSFVVIWDRMEENNKVHVVALPDGRIEGEVNDEKEILEIRTPAGWVRAKGTGQKKVEFTVDSAPDKKSFKVTMKSGEAILQTGKEKAPLKEGRSAELFIDKSLKEVAHFMEALPVNTFFLRDKIFRIEIPSKKEFKTSSEEVEFKGTWEGDYSVWANGQVIESNGQGKFTHTFKLVPGLNVITFQVSDPAKKNVDYFIYRITRS